MSDIAKTNEVVLLEPFFNIPYIEIYLTLIYFNMKVNLLIMLSIYEFRTKKKNTKGLNSITCIYIYIRKNNSIFIIIIRFITVYVALGNQPTRRNISSMLQNA
jgi:hypothetical protein